VSTFTHIATAVTRFYCRTRVVFFDDFYKKLLFQDLVFLMINK